MNIFDLETNPKYLPSSSITGKFQAPVFSKISITLSIGVLIIILDGGRFINFLTVNLSYKLGRNIIFLTSSSDTIPTNICKNESSIIEHEATVSKLDEDKLFYLMSRGIDEEKAIELSLIGFIEEFTEELPLEYAVELNNLLKIFGANEKNDINLSYKREYAIRYHI